MSGIYAESLSALNPGEVAGRPDAGGAVVTAGERLGRHGRAAVMAPLRKRTMSVRTVSAIIAR